LIVRSAHLWPFRHFPSRFDPVLLSKSFETSLSRRHLPWNGIIKTCRRSSPANCCVPSSRAMRRKEGMTVSQDAVPHVPGLCIALAAAGEVKCTSFVTMSAVVTQRLAIWSISIRSPGIVGSDNLNVSVADTANPVQTSGKSRFQGKNRGLTGSSAWQFLALVDLSSITHAARGSNTREQSRGERFR